MIRRVVSGSRLNPKNWFKKKKSWDELEKKDLAVLLPAEISVASLQRITLIPNHPLYLIANTAKSIIDETLADKSFNRKVDCIFRTERLLNKAIEERKLIKAKTVTASVKDTDTVATPAASSIESSTVSDVDLRLSFAHKYFSNLKNQCDSATIEAASRVSLVRLVDAIILGTSSERLLEHLRLFGKEFNQERLQESLYILYEPEVEATKELFVSMPGLHKDHLKGIPKFSQAYLLDKIELNSKARCSLAWSDPDYAGFQGVSNDLIVSIDDIVRCRRFYFPEMETVGKKFINDYIAERRLFYMDKKENRENIRNGTLFIVGTIILDWLIFVI